MASHHMHGQPAELSIYYRGDARELRVRVDIDARRAEHVTTTQLLDELIRVLTSLRGVGENTVSITHTEEIDLPIVSKNKKTTATITATKHTVVAEVKTPKRTYQKRFASKLFNNRHSAREWAVAEIERYDEHGAQLESESCL